MKTCILALALCVCAVPAFAQTTPPSNPNIITFDPSPSHLDPPGSIQEMTSYIMEIATEAAPLAVVKTADLGKPAIGDGTGGSTAGKVTYVGVNAITAKLQVGNYLATVKAKGPGGVSAGAVSPPFPLKALPPAAPGPPAWK